MIGKANFLGGNAGKVQQLVREIKLQLFLEHPNIIKLYDFFIEDESIFLVMEFACDGQLYRLMEERKKLSEESTSIIMRELIGGLHYMHKNLVIHRDLKLENIVFAHVPYIHHLREWSKYAIWDGASTARRTSAPPCAALRSTSPQKSSRENSTTPKWMCGRLERWPTNW